MKCEYPLVSIIVPVYNVEKYLEKCISSIRKQTYSNLEIILVDDGSPDSCPLICDIEAERDSRVTVIHKKNGGLSSARNVGIDIAKGKYLVFVDSDDYICENFVEILLRLCLNNNAEIAQCDYLAVSEKSQTLPLNPQNIIIYSGKEAVHNLCCGKNSVRYTVVWNKIYKKELFENIRFPISRIHEDEFTTYKVLWKANKVVVTSGYLYYYLQRQDSIMGSKFSLKHLDVIEALKERLAFMKECYLDDEYVATLNLLNNKLKQYQELLPKIRDDCKIICNALQEEIKVVTEELDGCDKNDVNIESEKYKFSSCKNLDNKKVIIYGAGGVGKACYVWLKKMAKSEIVGWIDNSWHLIKNSPMVIEPLDAIFKYKFDYVLIAVKSNLVQKEIKNNLMSWGIPPNKIMEMQVEEENVKV